MEILLLAALIVLNGVFAHVGQIALGNGQRDARLGAPGPDEGDTSAAMAVKLHDDPTRFLSTVQVGITRSASSTASSRAALAGPLSLWLQVGRDGSRSQPHRVDPYWWSSSSPMSRS